MVLGNLVEVAFLSDEFLSILFFKHCKVELKEPNYLRRVVQSQRVYVLKQVFKGRQQVYVHLRPVGWEVLFDENTHHKSQLSKGIVA